MLILLTITSCLLLVNSKQSSSHQEALAIVLEQQPVGTSVLNVSNIISQHEVPCRFHLLDSSEVFKVEEHTGEITTSSVIDRDDVCPGQLVCLLEVDAIADCSTGFVIVKVKVDVEDVDDRLPLFTESVFHVSIKEGENIDRYVALPAAIDHDSPQHTNTVYEVISPAYYQHVFTVVWSDNSLRLHVNGSLDAETDGACRIKVIAHPANRTSSPSILQVIITVEDVNDNPPIFNDEEYAVAVPEDTELGHIVITVQATDNDSSPGNSELRYRLLSHCNVFSINNHTGEVTLISTLRYEVERTYSVTVEAYDLGVPYLSSTCLIHVTVTDVNDQPPVIRVVTAHRDNIPSVTEHAEIGSFIAHVSVRDGDATSPNNKVICSSGSKAFHLKELNPKEYSLSVNADIDREETGPSLTIRVRCHDLGTPSLMTEARLTVIVEDIDDHHPAFKQHEYHVYNLTENQSLGSCVLNVEVSDEDEPTAMVYSLGAESENETSERPPFQINNQTGEITTRAVLDYEEQSHYEFQVMAHAPLSVERTATAQVFVHIVDQNDNIPRFKQTLYRFRVEEDVSDALVGQVEATDADKDGNSKLQYYLVEESNDDITIDLTTGHITTLRPLDREERSQYNLEVLVKDEGYPVWTSSVRVVIDIADVNDNSPHFMVEDNSSFTLRSPQNAKEAPIIFYATDRDVTDHQKLKYSLQSGPTFLRIEENTGQLYTYGHVTQTMAGSYHLIVAVIDTANNSDTLTATVTLQWGANLMQGQGQMAIAAVSFFGTLLLIMIIACIVILVRMCRHRKSQTYYCEPITTSDQSNIGSTFTPNTYTCELSGSPNDGRIQHHLNLSNQAQSAADSGCSCTTSPGGAAVLGNGWYRPSLVPYDMTCTEMEDDISCDVRRDSDIFNMAALYSSAWEDDRCHICLNNSVVSWSHTHPANQSLTHAFSSEVKRE